LKLKDIYRAVIAEGRKHDPREKNEVENFLSGVKKEYESLCADKKKFFDKERLVNPYGDTRILYGERLKEVKNILTGIDMETQELLLAEALSRRGKRIDLVLSHHPEGGALLALHRVMDIQTDLLEDAGVPRKKSKKLLDERIIEVSRKLHSANVMRPVDAAKFLGIPYMCAHTVADNCVSDYLSKLVEKNKPKTIASLMDLLLEEPEYRYAASIGAGPRIILGKPLNQCGKVLMEMTGGTGGSKKIFPELVKAGVKTILSMHISEENFKKAKKHKLSIIIAGHIASDSMGMNLLLGGIDPADKLNIIPCSGYIKVDR